MLSQPDPKSGSTSGGDRPRKRDRELARLGGHNDGNLAACENPYLCLSPCHTTENTYHCHELWGGTAPRRVPAIVFQRFNQAA